MPLYAKSDKITNVILHIQLSDLTTYETVSRHSLLFFGFFGFFCPTIFPSSMQLMQVCRGEKIWFGSKVCFLCCSGSYLFLTYYLLIIFRLDNLEEHYECFQKDAVEKCAIHHVQYITSHPLPLQQAFHLVFECSHTEYI